MAGSQWTRMEDKLFEEALVMFSEILPDRWVRIAEKLQKSPAEVREHYEALVHDVREIDSGRVDVPDYVENPAADFDSAAQISFGVKRGEIERKKGTPWTEDEHKLFLMGLKKYGKGDWRSISRAMVFTRTPTQVASHAQKYFLRQNSMKKERKRSSIHDITTVDSSLVAVPDPECFLRQNWTGQPKLETPLQPLPQQQPQPPQFVPGQGHPQFVPGQGHPQFVPGQGHPQFVPGQGHPQFVPEQGHPQFVPEQGHPQFVPEQGHPQFVPEQGHPQFVPEQGHPQFVQEQGHPQPQPLVTGQGHLQPQPFVQGQFLGDVSIGFPVHREAW